MANILYVTEAFDLDGENFQKGDELTAEQFEKLRHPKNLIHRDKVAQLPDTARGRLGMRDVTPNKTVHANLPHGDPGVTTGHSGHDMSTLVRDTREGAADDSFVDARKAQDMLSAPVAENEGDTRKSHLDTLMGEHADDPNHIQGMGVPPHERDVLGSKPAGASENAHETKRVDGGVAAEDVPLVIDAAPAAAPAAQHVIVDKPAGTGDGGTGGGLRDDRANSESKDGDAPIPAKDAAPTGA